MAELINFSVLRGSGITTTSRVAISSESLHNSAAVLRQKVDLKLVLADYEKTFSKLLNCCLNLKCSDLPVEILLVPISDT